MAKQHTAEEEDSLRRYILSEEDRAALTSEKWNGGYRWFRSPNVIPLEQWRRSRAKSSIFGEKLPA
jgi:hypothetical protein